MWAEKYSVTFGKIIGELNVSRIGKLPIKIPGAVTANIDKNVLTVKGPKGELTRKFSDRMTLSMENGEVIVQRKSDSKVDRSLHGLSRALISNMVQGVSEGFSIKLEIVGIGYKAETKGKTLILNVGYSHAIMMAFTDDISVTTPTPNEIIISGIDKEKVGKIAAKIRSYRTPEPYKGKGIKYADEYVRRKAGKTAGK